VINAIEYGQPILMYTQTYYSVIPK
jgi:hypothetical protein